MGIYNSPGGFILEILFNPVLLPPESYFVPGQQEWMAD